MTTAYTPLQYGWDVVYWLRVEGIPTVWIERSTSLTLPTWAVEGQDASLVVDVSAPIGSEVEHGESVGKALRLSWRLRDSAAARGYVATPSVVTRLDENITPSETSVDVEDASGLSSGDDLHVGPERMRIISIAGNTLTVARTSPYGYPHSLGTIATDAPRYWRGRTVWLYASPIDPTGYMPGSALEDNADLVWVGQIDDGPRRVESAFEWSALSIDRLLARPTVLEIAGTIQSTQPYYPADPGWTATMHLQGLQNNGTPKWDYALNLQPFAGLASGLLLSSDQIRAAITGAWDDEVSDLGATELGDMIWEGSDKQGWVLSVTIAYDSGVQTIAAHTSWGGVLPVIQFIKNYGGTGQQIVEPLPGKVFSPDVRQLGQGLGFLNVRSLVVELDEGDASDITAPGKVRIDGSTYEFLSAGTVNGLAVLSTMGHINGPKLSPLQVPGLEAQIVLEDSGECGEAMLRALESSGTLGLRGTYDTLAGGQGLGIDDDLIDEDSFLELALPELSIQSEGTWADTFGGLLSLLQRAALADRGELRLISTSPAGSLPTATIDNEALMSRKGSPIVSLAPAKTPTRIVVQHSGGEDAPDFKIVYTDQAAGIARGTTELKLEVPLADREQLASFATPLVASRFASSQVLQIVRVRVAPWLEVYPGDLVRLDISSADVWSWATSSPGLTGVARCLGRVMDLEDHVVELTLLADASIAQPALCPSAEVSTWSTSPTQPGVGDTIDVPRYFYDHFFTLLSLSNAGRFALVAYDPGDSEGVSDVYSINAVADTGSACRLTIAAVAGSPTLTANQTRLTYPAEPNGTDEQDDHAHVLDGGFWS